MNTAGRMVKRLFDAAVAAAGIVILCVPFLLLCAALLVTSGRPLFYLQRRVGRRGKLFTCVKFRTMYQGAEKAGTVTTARDGRVTPAGRFLRRWKLDELPQLLNVLGGKMSLVGPRPDVPGYADRLDGESRKILELRPGITGPATIYFRYEEEILAGSTGPERFNDEVLWPIKVRMNLDYLKHWSFLQDIGYILITLWPALNRRLRLIEEPPRSAEDVLRSPTPATPEKP